MENRLLQFLNNNLWLDTWGRLPCSLNGMKILPIQTPTQLQSLINFVPNQLCNIYGLDCEFLSSPSSYSTWRPCFPEGLPTQFKENGPFMRLMQVCIGDTVFLFDAFSPSFTDFPSEMVNVFTNKENKIAGFAWGSDAKALDNLYGSKGKIYDANGYKLPRAKSEKFTSTWSESVIDTQRLFQQYENKVIERYNPNGHGLVDHILATFNVDLSEGKSKFQGSSNSQFWNRPFLKIWNNKPLREYAALDSVAHRDLLIHFYRLGICPCKELKSVPTYINQLANLLVNDESAIDSQFHSCLLVTKAFEKLDKLRKESQGGNDTTDKPSTVTSTTRNFQAATNTNKQTLPFSFSYLPLSEIRKMIRKDLKPFARKYSSQYYNPRAVPLRCPWTTYCSKVEEELKTKYKTFAANKNSLMEIQKFIHRRMFIEMYHNRSKFQKRVVKKQKQVQATTTVQRNNESNVQKQNKHHNRKKRQQKNKQNSRNKTTRQYF